MSSRGTLYERLRELSNIIGNTPVIELRKLVDPSKMARVYVKLEYLNPTGSHKDRIALYMIKDAVERGLIKENTPVIEASSGNTGISIAWVCKVLGLRCIIVVPENTAESKKALLRALGAELVETPNVPQDHPQNCRNVARKLAEELGGVFLDQYSNVANMRAHYETTGPELWKQLGGRVDAFVMGVGTGGTIIGVGKYLRERKGDVLLVAIVPKGSPVVGGRLGEHIEGLAESLVPPLFNNNRHIIDRVIEVSQEVAIDTIRKVIREEGILAGPSTGANIYVALEIAKELGPGKIVATVAADSVWRYPELIK